ncbi:hypothetical protein VTJ49DRAFT_2084 [Mycothermus thermophilus]|uniref:Zn(2)-C6 fungal-type domain-containing protein n=1 Tax=Humicola insolens TaxID=85995 RepID=A0ABR3VCH3_HUMIN
MKDTTSGVSPDVSTTATAVTISPTPTSANDSPTAPAVTTTTTATTTTAGERPYHAKRPHRKSRTGCTNCKKRKVKCDEGRPSCRTCTARRETCVYLTFEKRRSPSSSPDVSSASLAVSLSEDLSPHSAPGTVSSQPLFLPGGRDELDMRLLWFYTAATYASFSTGPLKERSVDVILKVNIVQHAFEHPFLMNCVLGLSAMHANHLGVRSLGVTHAHEVLYRSRAFETYRKAVAAADPATYPALLATSLLLCGLSTHMFRGEDARPLAILDWMIIWMGIGEIIRVTRVTTVSKSGISALFWRPPVDYEASARHVPSYLLFMLTSVKPTDPEYPLVQSYYTALRLLGSLYRELTNGGFHPGLMLRIITFPTYLPKEVVDAARARRPRALIIVAHWLAWVKFQIFPCWWIQGISDYEIPNLCAAAGPEWLHLLRVPLAAVRVNNDKDLARLFLDDPNWEPPLRSPNDCTECLPATPESERELAIRAARGENFDNEVEDSHQDQIPRAARIEDVSIKDEDLGQKQLQLGLCV